MGQNKRASFTCFWTHPKRLYQKTKQQSLGYKNAVYIEMLQFRLFLQTIQLSESELLYIVKSTTFKYIECGYCQLGSFLRLLFASTIVVSRAKHWRSVELATL